MCQFDWALFNGTVSAISSVFMVIIALVAANFAYRQLKEGTKARLAQAALAINSDIQQYRNLPDVRKVRKVITDFLHSHPDPSDRIKAYEALELGGVSEFMARMNNLCWMISRMPEKSEFRNSILMTISENLIIEWDSLKPVIYKRRDERLANGSDQKNWYMSDFEAIVFYAKAHLK